MDFSKDQQSYFVYLTEMIRKKMRQSLNLPYKQDPLSKKWNPIFPSESTRETVSSHGSRNVLGHSVWTALYIQQFFNTRSRYVEGLDPSVATL